MPGAGAAGLVEPPAWAMTDAGGAHASPVGRPSVPCRGRPLPHDHRRGLALRGRDLPAVARTPARRRHPSGAPEPRGRWTLAGRSARAAVAPAGQADRRCQTACGQHPCRSATARCGSASPVCGTCARGATLFAQLVVSEGRDELHFMEHVAAELTCLNIGGRPICGRMQASVIDDLEGVSLMVDGLGAEQARRLMVCGLGPHRHLGCGLLFRTNRPPPSAAPIDPPSIRDSRTE